MKYFGEKNQYELYDQPIASGGEGAIFFIKGMENDGVAKLYHKEKLSTDFEIANKIQYMVQNPPSDSILDQVAWPLDILKDETGSFVGFIMPKLDTDTDLKNIYPYPPSPQMPISNEQKLIIAHNICVVISEIHKAGYVFGDFNPMNIGVNLKTGKVAFFDTDSYHFTDPVTGHTYCCVVAADGYVAPELIQKTNGKSFKETPLPTFTKETDNFALAIHIFKLLMNGYTPFNGIKECESASQSSPGTGNLAIERDNYCFKAGNKPQSEATPDLASLPEDVQYMFKKTFVSGVRNPSNRATADEWREVLLEYKNTMTQCKKNPLHFYYINNSKCPYCEADERYAQSHSQFSSHYAPGMSSSAAQMTFSNPVNVPPQQNKAGATKKKLSIPMRILKILLWIVFLPIMGIIKISKTNWSHGAKTGTIIGIAVAALIVYPLIIVGLASASSGNGNAIISPKEAVEGGLRFVKTEGAYEISVDPDSKTTISGEVVIPSEFSGLPVTSIAENGFENCSGITSVVVDNSVTQIGKGAFKGCDNLVSLSLPFIGQSEHAEDEQAVLGYIFGYESETERNERKDKYQYDGFVNDHPRNIGGAVWQYTYRDGGIGYNGEDTYYYYYIPNSLKNITITKQVSVPVAAFNYCSNLETVTYTNGFSGDIGECAFQNCTNVLINRSEDLIINSDVTKIGKNAFCGCEKIKTVVIPDSVTEIGCSAFKGCNLLESITLPFVGNSEYAKDEKAVLGYIFGYESETEDSYRTDKHEGFVNEHPRDVGGAVWQYTYRERGIGYWADITYYYYYIPNSLRTVIVTKQVTIPTAAFNSCSMLKSITLPKGSECGDYAFQNCNATVDYQ